MPFELYIRSRKPSGAPVFLKVIMPRGRTISWHKTKGDATRRVISDKILTVEWLESVLSQAILEFVDPPFVRLTKKKTPAAVKSTVLSVEVLAEPRSVRIGQSVALDLLYEIRANPGKEVEVRGIRSLSFQGQNLPKYPIVKVMRRKDGTYETRFSQRIPGAAQQGSYTYRGEVCVKGDCISRSTEFIVGR